MARPSETYLGGRSLRQISDDSGVPYATVRARYYNHKDQIDRGMVSLSQAVGLLTAGRNTRGESLVTLVRAATYPIAAQALESIAPKVTESILAELRTALEGAVLSSLSFAVTPLAEAITDRIRRDALDIPRVPCMRVRVPGDPQNRTFGQMVPFFTERATFVDTVRKMQTAGVIHPKTALALLDRLYKGEYDHAMCLPAPKGGTAGRSDEPPESEEELWGYEEQTEGKEKPKENDPWGLAVK